MSSNALQPSSDQPALSIWAAIRNHAWLFIIFVVGLAGGLISTMKGPSPQAHDLTAAEVALIATTAAVVIERLLELAWTIVGLTKGSFWPLNQIDARAEEVMGDLNQSLKDYQQHAQGVMDKLTNLGQVSTSTAEAAKKELKELGDLAGEIARAARDKGQIGAFASAAAQHLGAFEMKYGLFLEAAQKDHLNIASPDIEAAIAKKRAEELAAKAGQPNADKLADLAAATTAREQYVAKVEGMIEVRVAPEAARKGALAAFSATCKAAEDEAISTATAAGKTATEVAAAGGWAVADVARQYIFDDDATQLGTKVNVANKAIGGLTDFAASFKDNPGRRLLSLGFSCVLGLFAAGLFKLDVFTAILAASGDSAPKALSSESAIWFLPISYALYPGIILTGLMLGLGSAPTHEIIRVLQEYKQSQKRDNAPKAETSTVTETSTVR